MANKKTPPVFKPLDPEEVIFQEISPDEVIFSEEEKPESVSGAVALGTARATGTGAKYLTEKGIESAQDFLQGVQASIIPGWGEEIIGGARATISAPFSKESWEDLYQKYKKEESEELAAAKERSPVSTFAGEFAGGVAPALAYGLATKGKSIKVPEEKAKSFLEAIKKSAEAGVATGAIGGAISGLGESEADLLSGEVKDYQKAAKDILYGAGGGAVGGALFGGAIGGFSYGAGKAAKKLSEMENTYFSLKDSKTARILKKNKIDFEKDNVKDDLLLKSDEHAYRMAGSIFQAEANLGKQIEDTVIAAADKPITIQKDFIDQLGGIREAIGGNLGTDNRKTIAKIIDNILTSGSANSTELYELRDSLKIMNSYLDDKKNPLFFETLSDAHRKIRDEYLKKYVRGFAEANKKYEDFKDAVPDTIFNRGLELTVPIVDPRTKKIQNLRVAAYTAKDPNYRENLIDHIRNDLRYAGRMGSSSDEAKSTFNKINNNLMAFSKKYNVDLKNELGIDPNLFVNETKNQIDILGLVQRYHGFDTGYGTPSMGSKGLKELLIPREMAARPGFTGRVTGTLLRTKEDAKEFLKASKENIIGKTAPAGVIKSIYSLSNKALTALADEVSDQFPAHAKALKDALNTNNTYKRNAAIFALSQNPDFRNFVPFVLEDIKQNEVKDMESMLQPEQEVSNE